MSQILTVTFDGKAFYPETQLNLEPNKRYQIQIVREEKPLFERESEVEQFLENADKAWQALRNDPQVWQEELVERQLWDITLLDGNKD
ncbi:hypothetical protein C7H19_12365 [Aphanothece hegewaldii CCALA 016]|uniref:DUF104 domain-containing protein n=1 Tax=Aphanothece hegewaldii CCALA 016 TaxID=2107694 RepID=A0A2T1LX46_9CHRO|nr:hypothetical protein [Aphanothece hegewaldii]PSF36757.1 hypothetical protein C7H19_12365 [Aphanothece hegewaldii CCALA 016]